MYKKTCQKEGLKNSNICRVIALNVKKHFQRIYRDMSSTKKKEKYL